MKTLSDQLTELYESKWNGLMEQLEANGLRDKLQCPFLISLLRSGQKKEERELMINGMLKKELLNMKNGTPKPTSKSCSLVKSQMVGNETMLKNI